MKQLISLAMCLLLPVLASAQKSGQFTITPRVGVTLASFTGGPKDVYSYKAGFAVGADAAYQFNNIFGVSAGLFYDTQGSKENGAALITGSNFSDLQNLTLTDAANMATMHVVQGKNAHIDFNPNDYDVFCYIYNPRDEVAYVSLPVLLQARVWQGLKIKAGIQFDYLVSAKIKADTQVGIKGEIQNSKFTQDVKWAFKKNVFSIPLGLSYSYQNIELDARYLLGLTKVADFNASTNTGVEGKNTTFMLTVGYNFNL